MQIRLPCLGDRQGEPREYVDGIWLKVRVQVMARCTSPLWHMPRGLIAAPLDSTAGPFSCSMAPPSVTSALNLQYGRTVTSDRPFIACLARLRESTPGTLCLEGEALSPKPRAWRCARRPARY